MKHVPDRNLVLQTVAFGLAIVAGIAVLLVPLMTEVKVLDGGPETVRAVTLLSVMGPSIFVPLLVPVALTGLPLLLRGRIRGGSMGRLRKVSSIVTASGLGLFAIISSATIGWFYLPATVAAFMTVSRPLGEVKPRKPIRH